MDVILTIKPLRCTHTFGAAPCQAVLGAGETAAHKCYNTRTTCRDLDNINLVEDDTALIFSTRLEDRPDAIQDGISPTISEAKIQSGTLEFEGVASENRATLTLIDETTLVEVDDPYRLERDNCGGSRWGRLLERDRLLHSYSASLRFKEPDESVWIETNWFVAAIQYPVNGQVEVSLTDPVTRRLSQPYPKAASKSLSAAANKTSAALPGVILGADDGDYWRVNSEIVKRNGSNFTRGQLGTEAKDHKIGDSVTPVEVIPATGDAPWHEAFVALLADALPGVTDAADIASKAAATAAMKVAMIIHRVEPLQETLAQLCMAGQVGIYFDIFTGTMRHRPTTLFETPDAIINAADVIDRPPSIKTLVSQQRTRSSYRYRLSDPTDNRSYRRRALAVDLSSEGSLGYEVGDSIENQYAGTGDAAAARRVQRYARLPRSVDIVVPARKFVRPPAEDNAIAELGTIVALNYPESLQGVDGCEITLVTSVKQFSIDLIRGKLSLRLWSLNLLEYTPLPGTPEDPGGAGTISVFITHSAEDVDLFNLAGQPFVEDLTIAVTISDGVIIGGVGQEAMRIAGFPAGTIIEITTPGQVWIVGSAGVGADGGTGLYVNGDYDISFEGTFQMTGGGGAGGNGSKAATTHDEISVANNIPGVGGIGGGYRAGAITLPGGGGGGGGVGFPPGDSGDGVQGGRDGTSSGDIDVSLYFSGEDGGDAGDGAGYGSKFGGGGGGGGGGSYSRIHFLDEDGDEEYIDGVDGGDAAGRQGGSRWPGPPDNPSYTYAYHLAGAGYDGGIHFLNAGDVATIDQSAATIKCGSLNVVIATG